MDAAFLGSLDRYADADVNTWIKNVEARDGQTLENVIADAMNTFVTALKTASVFSLLTHLSVHTGPRTAAGGLITIRGTATGVNISSGDYGRKTGFKGDGTTKYIETSVQGTTNPSTIGGYLSTTGATNTTIGCRDAGSTSTMTLSLGTSPNTANHRMLAANNTAISIGGTEAFLSMTRVDSTATGQRNEVDGSYTNSVNSAFIGLVAFNSILLGRNNGGTINYNDGNVLFKYFAPSQLSEAQRTSIRSAYLAYKATIDANL